MLSRIFTSITSGNSIRFLIPNFLARLRGGLFRVYVPVCSIA